MLLAQSPACLLPLSTQHSIFPKISSLPLSPALPFSLRLSFSVSYALSLSAARTVCHFVLPLSALLSCINSPDYLEPCNPPLPLSTSTPARAHPLVLSVAHSTPPSIITHTSPLVFPPSFLAFRVCLIYSPSISLSLSLLGGCGPTSP